MLFCDGCGRLKQRRRIQGELVSFCPECESPATGTATKAPAAKKPVWRERNTAEARANRARVYGRGGASGGSGGSFRSQGQGQARLDQSPAPSRGAGGSGSAPRAKAREGRSREPAKLQAPEKLKVDPGTRFFPYDSVRKGQDRFIDDVKHAMERGEHLVACAPTGLGKTVSSLAPALEYALGNGKRVFFLTSKQSQHKIAIETLRAIRRQVGVPFVVSDVIGKQDMCPRPEAKELFSKRFAEFCRRQQVSGECSYWESQNTQAVRFLRQDIHHVGEMVDLSAERFHVCPHQTALDMAQQAHVVVCDYNYFFSDMREGMQERIKVDLSETILIVDEAHNLPDRIRDHLSLELSDYVLDDAIEECHDVDNKYLARVLEGLRGLLTDLASGLEGEYAERHVERDEWVDAVDGRLKTGTSQLVTIDYEALVTELEQAEEEFEERVKEPPRGLALVREFLQNWKNERRGLVRVLSGGLVPTLQYKLLDPAVLARGVFQGVHASVVMSGTLYPMEMYRDVLGLDPDRARLAYYPSPFPEEHRTVVVDDQVTSAYRERGPEMYARLAERIAGAAEAVPGNVAAFFTSYALMDEVATRLPRHLRRKELVVEEREQDKDEKERLVRGMKQGQNALLVGVQGGSLSEGYDYEDNMLKGVFIVGLPLPPPSLEVDALIEYYQKKFGRNGRDYAYTYPAMNRVLQAAGRCIRSPEDRGAIVLFDKRFAWRNYSKCFPADFKPKTTRDPVADVQGFWWG